MSRDLIVAKLPDRTIFELFDSLKEKFGQENVSYKIDEVPFSEPPKRLSNPKQRTYAISAAHFAAQGHLFTVNIVRNANNSPYFDAVRLDMRTDRGQTAELALDVDEVIRSKIKLPQVGTEAFTESNLIGIFDKELSSLASMHQSLLEDAMKLKSTYEQQEAERRARFEVEQDEARQRLRKDEDESIARITSQKADLDTKLAEFDVSDHMRARRKQREQITLEIQEAITKPIQSKTSRLNFWFTAIFCVCASVLSGFLAFESFESFISASNSNSLTSAVADYVTQTVAPTTNSSSAPNSSSVNRNASGLQTENVVKDALLRAAASQAQKGGTYLLWMLAIRGALLSAIAVGFAAYVINLLRTSYEQETRYLRELQRYGMDINRASWIIETAMEMQSKENAELPGQWVEGACSGLFQFGKENSEKASSLAALGALMKLGPEVEVGPNGARMTIGKSGTKAAAKDT